MAEDRTSKFHDLLKRGDRFLSFGEIEAAKEALKAAIAIDRESGPAWYLLGLANRDKGDTEEARKCLKEAVRLGQNWLEPLEVLGTLEASLNNNRDAVRYLKQYMQRGGDEMSTLLTLVRAAFESKDCKTVLAATSKIIEKDDESAEAWVMRGICQAHLDRFNAACTSLNVAISLNPASISALNTVGGLSYESGNYEVAADLYASSHALNADQPEVLFRLGVSLWFREKWSSSIPLFEKYVELVPNDPKGWNNLGVVLREKGEVKRALECYNRALQLDGSLEVVKRNLGTAKEKQVLV
jgi:protein O-GlcNAc transferase